MTEQQLEKISDNGQLSTSNIATSIAEYLHNGSSLYLIPKINIPTLVLHSKDDSIIPASCLPVSLCLKNPNIVVLLTNRGSHCLFLQGALFPQENNRWFTKASKAYIDCIDSKLCSQVQNQIG